MFVLAVVVLCSISNVFAKSSSKTAGTNCGYVSCHFADPKKLNVHIVPHSHDDLGWLKTVDQYYHEDVQYIIDSVVDALIEDPERRFIQVEIAFFDKWWNLQTDARKKKVIELVNNGQLEFVGGGWSMNDEATVNYQSIIDQFTLGLRMLNNTFGECARPKAGWQIDPFGHSREMAAIFVRMGFDGVFFGRVDWRDKDNRLSTKNTETLWKTSANFEAGSAYLFTSILFNQYSAPRGFCFDITCSWRTSVVTNERSPLYKLQTNVDIFSYFVREQAAHYRSNNIIILMGDDFQYRNANHNFFSIDKLIKGFKQFQHDYRGRVMNLFYSTPSCYLKAVNEAGLSYSIKNDDFLPYASHEHGYWTGFYTSRPTLKRFERQGNNLLQILKQLTSFRKSEDNSTMLKNIMGVLQHHDAITGTAKEHVWHDYRRLLHKAMINSINTVGNIILKLISPKASTRIHKLTTCLLANITVCPQSNQDKFLAIIYNPLSRNVSHYVRLPVGSTSFKVTDLSRNVIIDYQVAKAPRNFQYKKLETSEYELVFYATDLPPLGFKVYEVVYLKFINELQPVEGDKKYTLKNNVFTVNIDEHTGKLSRIIFNETSYSISQQLMYYHGKNDPRHSSGAYIFRPSPSDSTGINVTNSVNISTYKGNLFEEVHQQFNKWLTQVIRIYKLGSEDHVEFDWIVGPIDTRDGKGKEIISRFTTNLNTTDVFYTDSNGREIIKRRRNYRSDYEYTNEEPLAGNYYPVTSRITLKDEEKNIQLSILNDRAQGGTSLKSGEIELMLHRKCLQDDGLGVRESLREEEFGKGLVVRGQLYLTIGSIHGERKAAVTERDLAQRKLLSPWVFLNATSLDSIYNDLLKKEISAISKNLPLNVHLLTLEPLDNETVLVRFEHIFEKNEDTKYSRSAIVDLDGLFKYFEITSMREVALAADRWLDEVNRLDWNEQRNTEENDENYKRRLRAFQIILKPMEIRTFMLTIKVNTTSAEDNTFNIYIKAISKEENIFNVPAKTTSDEDNTFSTYTTTTSKEEDKNFNIYFKTT